MTHVHTDRTSFFHSLKVHSKEKTGCIKILGRSGLFRRHQESFVTVEANGWSSLPVYSSSCGFTSIPLLLLLLSSHAQTSRPFLNVTFINDPGVFKCHYELPCVYESHSVHHGLVPPSANWPMLHIRATHTTRFCCPPCWRHKPPVGFLRRLIIHFNDSIFMIFSVYCEWLRALE